MYLRAISNCNPPRAGGLIFGGGGGGFNGGFFALRFWGAYIWRGLYMGGLIFGILQYVKIVLLFLLITFEVNEFLAVILSIQIFVQEVIAFIQLLTEWLLTRI